MSRCRSGSNTTRLSIGVAFPAGVASADASGAGAIGAATVRVQDRISGSTSGIVRP
ncbi:MAG: hypothetical protein ACMVO3_25125 [Thalassobaculum sp.]